MQKPFIHSEKVYPKIVVRTKVGMVWPKCGKYQFCNQTNFGAPPPVQSELPFEVCFAKNCRKQKKMLEDISQPPKFDKVTTKDFRLTQFQIDDMGFEDFKGIPKSTPGMDTNTIFGFCS